MTIAKKIEWDSVDWSKQDVELAAMYGYSREAVRQARKRLGVGRAIKHHKRTSPTIASCLSKMDTGDKTLPELAKLVGCQESYVLLVLNDLGKGYKRRLRGNAKYDWTKFPSDWALKTDKEIAVEVGVDDPVIVTQWRNRHGYRKQVIRKSLEMVNNV